MPAMLNLTGTRFGRLVALDVAGKDQFGAYLWRCKCDCGATASVRASSLKSGTTNSCGCGIQDAAQKPRTHGMTGTPIYSRWRAMNDRTSNPNYPDYHNYGGRGIRVCDRWHRFEDFYTDMGGSFNEDLELDRIDVNGDYSPANCRWATRVEQQRNKRTNHVVTWQGHSRTVQEWGETLGIKPNTLVHRLRRGWSVRRALSKGAAPNVLLEIANGGAL